MFPSLAKTHFKICRKEDQKVVSYKRPPSWNNSTSCRQRDSGNEDYGDVKNGRSEMQDTFPQVRVQVTMIQTNLSIKSVSYP